VWSFAFLAFNLFKKLLLQKRFSLIGLMQSIIWLQINVGNPLQINGHYKNKKTYKLKKMIQYLVEQQAIYS
jgi:hypothetical protein